MWKWIKKNFWSLTAIIISIISLCYDRSQNDKIDKQQYELSAINYRPCLVIDTIMFDSTSFRIKTADLTGQVNDSTGLITVKGEIFVKTKIRIRNTGNSNAKVILAATVDTICGLKKIRDELFSLNYNFFPDSIMMDSPYYIDIMPNKSYDYIINNKFSNFKENKIELHFFILYENEIGQLFDSYCWVKLKHSELNIDIKGNENEKSYIINNEIKDVKLSFQQNESIYFSTDIYNLEDNMKIKKFLKEYGKMQGIR
jgi:hypothetical protein